MNDPVVAHDGWTYERGLITKWLLWHDTSPLTNAPMASKALIPNMVLRSLIAKWRGDALPPPRKTVGKEVLAKLAEHHDEQSSSLLPHLSFWPSEIGGYVPPPSFYPLVALCGGLVLALPGSSDHELEPGQDFQRYYSWYSVGLSEMKPGWQRTPFSGKNDAPLLCAGAMVTAGLQVLCFGGLDLAEREWASFSTVWARTQHTSWERWDNIPGGDAIGSLTNFASGFDPTRARVFCFGGGADGTSSNDLWIVELWLLMLFVFLCLLNVPKLA